MEGDCRGKTILYLSSRRVSLQHVSICINRGLQAELGLTSGHHPLKVQAKTFELFSVIDGFLKKISFNISQNMNFLNYYFFTFALISFFWVGDYD